MGFEGLRGRVTDVVPMLLDAHELASGRVHVHLIGNGGMVNQMKAALLQVGSAHRARCHLIEEPARRAVCHDVVRA